MARGRRRGLEACALALFACGARTEIGGTRDAAQSAPPDAACVPRDFTLQVPATAPWTDTGIDVPSGAALTISSSGTVSYFGANDEFTGPDGGNFDGQKFFATAVLPNAIVVSLIGKIGGSVTLDTGTPLPEGTAGDGAGFVGSAYERTVPVGGRLFLGFNDQRSAFGDNTGAFTVTIRIGC